MSRNGTLEPPPGYTKTQEMLWKSSYVVHDSMALLAYLLMRVKGGRASFDEAIEVLKETAWKEAEAKLESEQAVAAAGAPVAEKR